MSIPTRRQPPSWRTATGRFRASQSGRKGRQPDPGLPIKGCLDAPRAPETPAGSDEHARFAVKGKAVPVSHDPPTNTLPVLSHSVPSRGPIGQQKTGSSKAGIENRGLGSHEG